ncbi:MAG: hypothetical protein QOJ16_2098 [Acidobacteriota bacterium]|nr:hypothetical protein [Acidobacteriota bacterium]
MVRAEWRAQRLKERLIATPHAPAPTGIVAITFKLPVAMTDRSFDSPLAV